MKTHYFKKLYFIILLCLFFVFNNATAEELSKIKETLNTGNINADTEISKQNQHNTLKKIHNACKIVIPATSKKVESIYLQNYKKVKIKGIKNPIIIPWVDQNSYKTNLSNQKNKPLRIGSKSAIPYIFSFPQNSNDPIRIEAEKCINDMAVLISSITPENFSSKYNEIINLAYGKILTEFGQYPDICAIAKFYIVEANIKNYPDSYCGGDNPYKWLGQIIIDYQKQENYNPTMKELLLTIAERQSKMIQNNENLKYNIDYLIEGINTLKSDINYYTNLNYYNLNQTYGAIDSINKNYSYIFSNYLTLINYYSRIGDIEKAKSIFDITATNENIEFHGEFYNFYKNIPYSITLKYGSSGLSVPKG